MKGINGISDVKYKFNALDKAHKKIHNHAKREALKEFSDYKSSVDMSPKTKRKFTERVKKIEVDTLNDFYIRLEKENKSQNN